MAAPAVDVVVPGLDVGAEEITEQQSQNVNEAHYSGDGSPRAVSASGTSSSGAYSYSSSSVIVNYILLLLQ